MKVQEIISEKLLGIYDLILALGAIFIGVMMVISNNGMFIEYPKEWLSKLPFESWVIPGIIATVLFGLGNIVAAIPSFRKENKKSWFVSAIMGGILFMSIVAQIIILGEWYLATVEILILSIIQLGLSGYTFAYYKRKI